MRNMRKFMAALLVLSMMMALCCTASAAKFTERQAAYGLFVEFTGNARGYKAANGGSATDTVVRKGSIGLLVDIEGDQWAKVVVTDGSMNAMGKEKALWFNVKDLEKAKRQKNCYIRCLFVSGGDGLSRQEDIMKFWGLVDKRITVAEKTSLRKHGSLQGKSLGTVKRGQSLTCTGVVAFDTRLVVYFQVKENGKKYFVNAEFIKNWKDVLIEALELEEGI